MNTQTSEPQEMTQSRAKWDRALISGVHMSYFAGTTIQSTFLVTFMGMMNYTNSEVGIIVALYSITNLLCQPIWGYLSDKYKNIKRFLLICLVATLPLILLLPQAVSSKIWHTAVLYALVGCVQGPCVGLIDSLTYSGMENNRYITYSFVRGMGSLFSAVTMLFAGRLLDSIGIQYAFMIEATLLVVTVICATTYKAGRYGKEPLPAAQVQQKTTMKDTIECILKNKPFIFLFISVLLINVGIKAGYTFVPRMVLDMGGSTADNGYVMAINTAGMMPCMLLYSFLLNKKQVSNDKLYIWACIFSIARIVSLALVRTLPQMFVIQIISSFQYGFLQPAMLTAIAKLVPTRVRSTAITLVASCQVGVSSLVGDFLAGRLVDSFGVRVVFAVFAVVAALGLLSYIQSMRLRRRQEAAVL